MRLPRPVLASLRALLLACFALVTTAPGQTVWSGLTFSFEHLAHSSSQDDVTPNVSLTRAATRGLYNAAYEVSYADGVSPEFTLWATEHNNPGANLDATNWADLIFEDWQTAFGGAGSLATNILNSNAVLFLTLDEIYLDIRFDSWGVGPGGGGAFSYMRAEPPLAGPTGDYNGDLVVDAADYTVWRDTFGQTVDNPGDGADGDLSGEIDLPDYDFWKEHFNETVPAGAGAQALAVPEPAVTTLVLGGLAALAGFRRFTPRGPGQLF